MAFLGLAVYTSDPDFEKPDEMEFATSSRRYRIHHRQAATLGGRRLLRPVLIPRPPKPRQIGRPRFIRVRPFRRQV